MTTGLENFRPANWHEHGVLCAVKAPRKSTMKRRAQNIVLSTSFVILSTAWVTPVGLTLRATAASRPTIAHSRMDESACDVVAVDATFEESSDRINPSEWGRLITLFSKLPRDQRRDPVDPEPFI